MHYKIEKIIINEKVYSFNLENSFKLKSLDMVRCFTKIDVIPFAKK